jgi:hypothetical protein
MKLFLLRVVLAVALLSLAVLAALLLIQRGDLEATRAEAAALRSEVESLRAAGDEVERLRKLLEKLKAEAVDPLEIARLRARAAELDKVKVELQQARAQAAAAQAATAAAIAATEQKKAMVLPLPRIAHGSVALAQNQSFVTGGWDMGNGRRAFAFVSPQLQQADDGGLIVVVRTQLVEMPEATAGALGLQGIAAAGAGAGQVGLLDNTQVGATLQQLRGAEGVQFLSAPVLSTRLGDSGQIQLGDVAAGTGISLLFQPQVGADGKLNVGFSFTLPGGAPQ